MELIKLFDLYKNISLECCFFFNIYKYLISEVSGGTVMPVIYKDPGRHPLPYSYFYIQKYLYLVRCLMHSEHGINK